MEPRDVNQQTHIDPEALIREITRYLAAVDAFRTEPRRQCARLAGIVRLPTQRTLVRPTDDSTVRSREHGSRSSRPALLSGS